MDGFFVDATVHQVNKQPDRHRATSVHTYTRTHTFLSLAGPDHAEWHCFNLYNGILLNRLTFARTTNPLMVLHDRLMDGESIIALRNHGRARPSIGRRCCANKGSSGSAELSINRIIGIQCILILTVVLSLSTAETCTKVSCDCH